MDKPVKVIHKYKNSNRRIQYHVNIFIGDLLDEKTMRVLNKIKDMTLIQSLTISTSDRRLLVKTYGERWYEFFFVSHHVHHTFLEVEKNNLQKGQLIDLYGEEWYLDHVLGFTERLQSVEFNYEYSVREERERKNIRKIIQQQREDIETNEDYGTTDRSFYDIEPSRTAPVGGRGIAGDQNLPFMIDEGPDTTGWCSATDETTAVGGAPSEEVVLTGEDVAGEEDSDYIDYDFTEVDIIDPSLNLTTREIKKAISEETYNKIQKQIVPFDTSNDDLMIDSVLKNVYTKIYIKHQYIYQDDTINTIQKKICVGFKNNEKFGENSYLVPSQQYLWSEYMFQGKIQKIMLGYKWIVRNDILKIDIEPNSNIRVYEELRKPLSALRDNIKRQGRIKAEDDVQTILYDYKGFYTCNEVYLLDIHNEFGLDYSPSFEEMKNLLDVYLRIYFPRIRPEDLKNIISSLNQSIPLTKRNADTVRARDIYETINNEILMESDVMRDVEKARSKKEEIDQYFHQNYVTQSVVRAYVIDPDSTSRGRSNRSVDLYRVFDNFELGHDYPFIQYQPSDGAPRIRYSERELIAHERKDTIAKWFENSPYGINFKVRYQYDESRVPPGQTDKYMTVNLSDTGKINYKIVWKESDASTLEDITRTYDYIYRLVSKINQENESNGLRLKVPQENDFRFAFISTIQKFELPGKYTINHNDLSEFSRCFFPYIAMVIEPRKRKSKINKKDAQSKSKFGTYFRYKRISKYENKMRIENRIFFFMRNYEYDDASLSSVISKEFNITEEQAFEEVKHVREKHPNIRKFRRNLKKFDNIPKYTPPGIEADIQGKKRDRYKLKISGARDREQLERITEFMKILIYLYIETYIHKNKEYQTMRDRLKSLTRVAKRLGLVDEVPDAESVTKSIKKIINIDRARLGSNANEDQSQWTRNCQNSGNDKKRQPQYHLSSEEMEELGYEWVEELDGIPFGHYQKKVTIGKGSSKETVALRAIKLEVDHPEHKHVYWTCDPDENGRHMYIGFLNKSKTQGVSAVPCCFIKDHYLSKNPEKKNYYLRSIGAISDTGETERNRITGDQLYILQDSNKIQEGRFGFLPKYMDMFFNGMLGHTRRIKNHYLVDTPTGYYFKYGSSQLSNRYLGAVASVFDLTVSELKEKMISMMEKDRLLSIFNSLNNGDIRMQFGTLENYLEFLRYNEFLDYQTVGDLLATPGLLSKKGANIIVFQRKVRTVKKSLEKERIKESYHLICQNNENLDDYFDSERPAIIIIKENRNYYPIIRVSKSTETARHVMITKTFQYEETQDNIVRHIFEYYQTSCKSEYDTMVNRGTNKMLNAKNTVKTLTLLGEPDYLPRIQVIDARYRCKYIITKKNHIIPVVPSGTIYSIPITFEVTRYFRDFQDTLEYLRDLAEKTQTMNLPIYCRPTGAFYSGKEGRKYLVSAIMAENSGTIPITKTKISQSQITAQGLDLYDKPNDETIDKEVMKGVRGQVVDSRVLEVSKKRFETEAYELFRFHLSYFMENTAAGQKLRTRLINLLSNPKLERQPSRKYLIKKLLYQSISSDLLRLYVDVVKRVNPELLVAIKGGEAESEVEVEEEEGSPSILESVDIDYRTESSESPTAPSPSGETKRAKWIRVYPDTKTIDHTKFTVDNNRQNCYIQPEDRCQSLVYCQWSGLKKTCSFALRQETIVDFVNRVAEEFEQNSYLAMEILQVNDYFVSDIVDRNVFKERSGERIVSYNNSNLKKILGDIFGKDAVPVVAKRRNRVDLRQDYDLLNTEHPLKTVGSWHFQEIIANNNTIFRAFTNAYYWLLHPYSNEKMRNLGYYSLPQTKFTDLYKSEVIERLLSPSPEDVGQILGHVKNRDLPRFIRMLSNNFSTVGDGIVELYYLSQINETIIRIYNEKFILTFFIHPSDGIVYDVRRDKGKTPSLQKYDRFSKVIHLRFHYLAKTEVPDRIDALYPRSL